MPSTPNPLHLPSPANAANALRVFLPTHPLRDELDAALWTAYVPTFGDPAEPRYRRALDFRATWSRTLHAWLDDTVEPCRFPCIHSRALIRVHLLCEWVGGMEALLRRLVSLTGLSPVEAEELADTVLDRQVHATRG